MSWYVRLKVKFWRKRIYKTVLQTSKVCLSAYYYFSAKYPDSTNEELYKMVLKSRNYTELQIESLLTEANSMCDVIHLVDIIYLVAMEELPWELDVFVKTPLQSKFDLEKDHKLVETYQSLYEIVSVIIPERI